MRNREYPFSEEYLNLLANQKKIYDEDIKKPKVDKMERLMQVAKVILTDKQWESFYLMYKELKSVYDISVILTISENSVKDRLRRARWRLKKYKEII